MTYWKPDDILEHNGMTPILEYDNEDRVLRQVALCQRPEDAHLIARLANERNIISTRQNRQHPLRRLASMGGHVVDNSDQSTEHF